MFRIQKLEILFIIGIFTLSVFPAFAEDLKVTTKKDIVLGMSTALSGPAEDLGKNMLSGVLTGFSRVNTQGGINGQKIRLIAYDDGYEPKRTVPNMNKLIDEDQVLAIIGNVGTPTAIAAIPIVNDKKVLFFAPYTGAGVLRKTPPDRYVINFRASYAEETSAMIDALINHAKLKIENIAFFTQRDGYGDAGFNGGIQALKQHGLKSISEVTHVRYERNTLAVEGSAAEILLLENTPKAIILVGAYGPCAKFIQLLKENDINPIFLNVSFVGTKSLALNLGVNGEGVIVTQVVPHYHSELPIVKNYLRDLQEFRSEDLPSFGGLEGYIASQIFIKALKQAKTEINRETIIDAIESLNDFDIGLEHPLQLNGEDHHASHIVWPTIMKGGSFIPFEWKELESLF